MFACVCVLLEEMAFGNVEINIHGCSYFFEVWVQHIQCYFVFSPWPTLHFGHKQEKCEELQKQEECEESQKELPPVSAQETLRLIPARVLNSVTK